MIVAPIFTYDTDSHVMEIQHRLYRQCIGVLASEVCRHFIFASAVTDGGQELTEKLNTVREHGVDHRILQAVHDQVAGHFRQTFAEELQPALPLEGDAHEAIRIESDWTDFWASAVKWICEDAMALRAAAICLATTGGRNDPINEDGLLSLVSARFSIL
jgi:hypothetical protein